MSGIWRKKSRHRRLARSANHAIESLEQRVLLTIRYVDVNAGGANDGGSWQNAYTDLQSALGVAVSGDDVRVADGTYYPTSGSDRTISFNLPAGVTLEGGYAGASDPNAPRDVSAYITRLSGDIGNSGDSSDNTNHIVSCQMSTLLGATLDGFTIAAGHATDRGGGFNLTGAQQATMIVANCTFTGNLADIDGGAIYDNFAAMTLSHCNFTANQASSGNGGAIYLHSLAQPVSLIDSTFVRNVAKSGGAIKGAVSSSTAMQIQRCAFEGNVAGSGGAIVLQPTGNPGLVVSNSIFSGNSASFGGACFSSNTLFQNCTFAGNVATVSGGAIDGQAMVNLANSIFWGNTAPTGAQLFVSTQPTLLINSDIQGGWSGGTHIADIGPQFIRNPSPGTDGAWGTADDDYGDLHLSPASPVVDAGSNITSYSLDLDGNNRFQDVPTMPDTGTGSGPIVDMGAYEATAQLAAEAGGPYLAPAGKNAALTGYGASNISGKLSYAWEWSGDNNFDDATGPDPIFSASLYSVGSVVTISLRVTDAGSHSIVSTTTVTIIPATIYVDSHAVGTADGMSWTNAYPQLETALAGALPGQTVEVAGGTYLPTTSTDLNAAFFLPNGVQVLGGFAGNRFTNADVRNINTYPTILSGDIGTAGLASDNSRYVVVASEAEPSTLLDGVTISDARTAGLYCYAGALQIQDAIIKLSGLYGLLDFASSPSLTHCTISQNVGSGIFNDGASALALTGCLIAGNSGGGINDRFASSTTLIQSILVGNTSSGAIDLSTDSIVTLINCDLVDNKDISDGGGISVPSDSFLSLANCILWGNTAPTNPEISNLTSVAIINVSYSDIQGGFSGMGNLNADPLFTRGATPGADGAWGTADDDYGDLTPQAGSPVLDAGSNAAVPSSLNTDLAGNDRYSDIPSVHDPGVIVDMGAYERVGNFGVINSIYQTDGSSPSLQFTFSRSMLAGSFDDSDMVVQPIAPDGSLGNPIAAAAVSYDAVSRTATFNLPVNLADGNYHATLNASVSDASGNVLASPYTFDTFVLAGDVNHDRMVDINDLYTLASHFGATAATYSQGDLDYDGDVDAHDLGILGLNWQKTLLPVTPVLAPVVPTAVLTGKALLPKNTTSAKIVTPSSIVPSQRTRLAARPTRLLGLN